MSAIDDQNAKQIRDAMDVVIQLDATATSYGDVITITNENLIRATVSLRSDLSILEPTLPESEINVEAYWPEDVAEEVAGIPEDTPITYSAGYPGDMSPERKFYVSGQVTWADNVLTIHGVDAVHFLDVTVENLCFWSPMAHDQLTEPVDFAKLITGLVQANGVEITPRLWAYRRPPFDDTVEDLLTCVILRGATVREIIAFFMQFFHLDGIPSRCIWTTDPPDEDAFWPIYVDAGAPAFTQFKPTEKWSINESDCGDVAKQVDPVIGAVNVNYSSAQATKASLSFTEMICGTVDWSKTGEAYPNFDTLVSAFRFGLPSRDIPGQSTYFTTLPILPANDYGYPDAPYGRGVYTSFYAYRSQTISRAWFGATLYDESTPQNVRDWSGDNLSYTQVVPQNAAYSSSNEYKWRSQSAAWAGLVAAGLIDANAENAQLNIYGRPVSIVNKPITIQNPNNTPGITVEIDPLLKGWAGIHDPGNNSIIECYPTRAFESIFNRSNVTGSFRWKGDPRQQPRDVATFVLRDGTEETITLENITIQHEKGGTYADYTYRKGIV